jgi:hypothetical protein
MEINGYEKLADVLSRAYEQAAAGKGKERHASEGQAFEDQPMNAINQALGSIDGFLFQAAKKAQESRRLPNGRAQAELLGAINYLAGAVIALDSWASGLLPAELKYDPEDVAFQGSCCGMPSFCENPCFHQPEQQESFDFANAVAERIGSMSPEWFYTVEGQDNRPRGNPFIVAVRRDMESILSGRADGFDWACEGKPGEIVAYRVGGWVE